MYIALLLGKSEVKTATQDELHLLRLLTPLVKLYTAKQVIKQKEKEKINYSFN